MLTKGQETRNRIIQTSRQLFTRQGFQNTSISEIIAATGVKKGNLYYHFPSKEELGIAVLTDARDEFYTILDNSFAGKKPEAKIIHSCDSIMALMQQTNFVGGCLFGNTALEMTDSSSRFGIIVREVFSRWTDMIAKELHQVATTSTGPINPNILATAIVAILEGGIMLSRVYNDKTHLNNCISIIKMLVENKN